VSLDEFMAGLTGSYLASMDCDLAFIVMCEQIKDADRRIRGMMGEIRQIGAMRDAISKHIDRLREFESKMKRLNGEGFNAEDCHRWVPGDDYAPLMTEYQDLRYRPDFAFAEADGAVTRTATTQRIGSTDEGASLCDVGKEIKFWENKAQELDQNREVKLVELNSLISKRANALELLSNMEKKKHESQHAVIANLR
jgi:hypothetical protein